MASRMPRKSGSGGDNSSRTPPKFDVGRQFLVLRRRTQAFQTIGRGQSHRAASMRIQQRKAEQRPNEEQGGTGEPDQDNPSCDGRTMARYRFHSGGGGDRRCNRDRWRVYLCKRGCRRLIVYWSRPGDRSVQGDRRFQQRRCIFPRETCRSIVGR